MSAGALFPPQNEEALCDLVRAFAAQGRAVAPVGNGTKAHHGPACGRGLPPPIAGRSGPEGPSHPVTVSLRGLDRITHYEPGDLVVCAQAGMRVADLQAELAKHGQWLPLDPPYADATIGGVLATNSSGPRRLAYGTARDLLIGMRVVEANGVVTKSGGRVVKNVTGYDLHKLHIGAFGTLGIIAEANFKVRPLPEVSAVFAFAFDTFQAAHEALLRVSVSPLRPCALEALDGAEAAGLREPVGAQHAAPLRVGALALVGVEGSRPVIERHARDLPSVVGAAHMAPLRLEGDAAAAVWAALRDLRERLKAFVRVRVGAKPHDLPGAIGGRDGVRGLWARVGTGLAWLDLEPAADVPERIAALHAKAAAVGGYAVAESAPLVWEGALGAEASRAKAASASDAGWRERLPWGVPDDGARAIMRKIREAWDATGVLNPGRMAL